MTGIIAMTKTKNSVHGFNVAMATEYGATEALFISVLLDLKKEVVPSVDELLDIFPYLSKKQIEKVTTNCLEKNLLSLTLEGEYIIPLAKSKETAEGFETFWEAYPKGRRIDKQLALKAFVKALKKDSFESIVQGAQRYAEITKDTEPKYIKLPATFLNSESWRNDYAKMQTEKPTEQHSLIARAVNKNMALV